MTDDIIDNDFEFGVSLHHNVVEQPMKKIKKISIKIKQLKYI